MSEDFRFQIADSRLQISEFRFQISYFRFQIPDFRLQISDFTFQIADSRAGGTRLQRLGKPPGRLQRLSTKSVLCKEYMLPINKTMSRLVLQAPMCCRTLFVKNHGCMFLTDVSISLTALCQWYTECYNLIMFGVFLGRYACT